MKNVTFIEDPYGFPSLDREYNEEIPENGDAAELESAAEAEPVLETVAIEDAESCIEAMLFMSSAPVPAARLREALGAGFSIPAFQEAVTALKDRYKSARSGIELVEVAGGMQLRTKPERAGLVRKLSRVQAQKLSAGAMETLAVIAYRQPVMREDVDKVRGVDSTYFLRGLMEKNLVQIAGRSELPGRPMLYSTTREFLELFGLKTLDDLPPMSEIESSIPASQSDNPHETDERLLEMRKMVGEMKQNSDQLGFNPKDDEVMLAEMRERIKSINISTPLLDEQKRFDQLPPSPITLSNELEAKQQESQPVNGNDAAPVQEAPVLDAEELQHGVEL